MSEITFTQSEVVALLALTFSPEVLAEAKENCPKLAFSYDAAGRLKGQVSWYGMLHEAELRAKDLG